MFPPGKIPFESSTVAPLLFF